jgi:glucose-6-phosphate 1-dehydrogenase
MFVIFGASGDLTKRKLMPALYALFRQQLIPPKVAVVGVGRTAMTDESFRAAMRESVTRYSEQPTDEQLVAEFSGRLHYERLDEDAAYPTLKARLDTIASQEAIPSNCVFYLATPPAMYETIALRLAQYGLHRSNGAWRRIVIEKPFGYDLASAQALNEKLLRYWTEDQLYRIDHYLGKETVQNLLAFRFSNEIFEPLWNSHFIHHVQITSCESIGVENRGKYYDGSGLMRDMVQNHLLQLVGMIAMEPPARFDARSVRNETIKVFESLKPLKGRDVERCVIRGQYTAATIRGEHVPGYREERDVPPDSRTETFVAMRFFIDNWRWSGVPFYIRAGKRLPTRVTEAVIHFKPKAYQLFGKTKTAADSNQLIIRIQPDEGILLKFGMKLPGAGFNIKSVDMDFHYADLSEVYVPAAYERLLLDCWLGDATLFTRNDAVEACWRYVDPILEEWRNNPNIRLYGYPAGTWGPKEADTASGLFAVFDYDEMRWRFPCKNLSNDGLYCEL